jgi:hypothetical protein
MRLGGTSDDGEEVLVRVKECLVVCDMLVPSTRWVKKTESENVVLFGH